MLDRLLGALFGFVAIGTVYICLERAFAARPAERFPGPAWRTDACFFFGQYLVWSVASLWMLAEVNRSIDAHPATLVRSALGRLPLVVLAVVSVVLGDVLVYWFHRACHQFDFLWRFHAVHHSSERVDWLAAHREHPLDGVLTQLCQNLPAMVLGLPFEVLGALIVFRGAWAILVHSNVRLPLGPLRFILGAPELHHFHHARLRETRKNFANLAPWLDVVFRTYHRPRDSESLPTGLTEPFPKGYFAQLAHPFRFGGARPSVEGAPRGPFHSRDTAETKMSSVPSRSVAK